MVHPVPLGFRHHEDERESATYFCFEYEIAINAEKYTTTITTFVSFTNLRIRLKQQNPDFFMHALNAKFVFRNQ